MNQKYYLVKFYANYADEFDIQGFGCYTEKEWNLQKDLMSVLKGGESYNFGTNEYVEYKDCNYVVSELSEFTYNTIIVNLSKEYGMYYSPAKFLSEEDDIDIEIGESIKINIAKNLTNPEYKIEICNSIEYIEDVGYLYNGYHSIWLKSLK